jgi:AraC-like DNA-binding protein
MYGLGMNGDMDASGIVSFAGPSTPIGSVKFGGRLKGASGTGFSQYRVYPMYALVLLLEGGGRYRDRRGTDRRLRAGDWVVVFPDLPHQYGPEPGDVWDEIFIAFEGAAFEGWRAHGFDAAHPVWPLADQEKWARRFSEILGMPSATMSEACALASAVHGLIADALAARPEQAADWLESARQALGGGSGAPSLVEIAAAAGMGYETFRKAFKAATGESPARYRRRQRLAQAALMMRRADLSLEMIAGALGFCDAFHLSKAFKACHGLSPAAYRARLQIDS